MRVKPLREAKPKSFMGWRDLTITPLVSAVTLAVPGMVAWWIMRRMGWSLFPALLIFFLAMILFTFAVIALIRRLIPLAPGTYEPGTHPWTVYAWTLVSFLSITNLSFQYMNALIPPPMRKFFYALMGARMGGGIISIGGRITDAYLVTVEAGAMLGDDSLILAHALAPGPLLILSPVTIKANAVVGARCVIMPGVTIGENAMVKAMSLVTMNTQIGANEVWGGVPAKKMTDS